MKFSSALLSILFLSSFEAAAKSYPIEGFCKAAPGRCYGDKTYSCSGDQYSAVVHIKEKGLDPKGPSYTYFDVAYTVSSSQSGKVLLKGSDWGNGSLEQERPPMLLYSFATNPHVGPLRALWLHTDDARNIRLHYYGKQGSFWLRCTAEFRRRSF